MGSESGRLAGSAIGYLVYVGIESGVYTATYDAGNATSLMFRDAVAGQQYYFAVAACAPGPLIGPPSAEVSGFSNAPPVLINPGNQASMVGESVTLQLLGSDPYDQPVSYSATGLPSGLGIVASTGLIAGTPIGSGTYTVTAVVSDGVLSNA